MYTEVRALPRAPLEPRITRAKGRAWQRQRRDQCRVDETVRAAWADALAPLADAQSATVTFADVAFDADSFSRALDVVLAVAGKGLACMAAAKWAGEPWREAATIGTLMNARGLMELIILNIGLQQSVITPTLFTMLVLMAIVTTLMASPLFEGVYGKHLRKKLHITEPGPLIEST